MRIKSEGFNGIPGSLESNGSPMMHETVPHGGKLSHLRKEATSGLSDLDSLVNYFFL